MERARNIGCGPPRSTLASLLDIYAILDTVRKGKTTMATQIELYYRIREAMADDAEVVALCDKHIAPYESRKDKSGKRTQDVRDAIKRLSSRGVGRFSARMVKEECGLDVNDGKGYTIQAASVALRTLAAEGYITQVESEKGEPKMYSVA